MAAFLTPCGFRKRCELADAFGGHPASDTIPNGPQKGLFGRLARPAKRHYTFARPALIRRRGRDQHGKPSA
jgi:hypothetical protein